MHFATLHTSGRRPDTEAAGCCCIISSFSFCRRRESSGSNCMVISCR